MLHSRAWPTVHSLGNGAWLALGGGTGSERLDSVSGSWRDAGEVPGVGYWHAATDLPNGDVIAMGGYSANGVAVYRRTSGTWVSGGLMPDRRYGHRLASFEDGGVLLVGGSDPVSEMRPLSTPVFNTLTGGFVPGASLAQSHHFATLTLLCDGSALVAGGFRTATSPTTGALERLDPEVGAWRDAGVGAPRTGHTATVLPNNQVLLVGGQTPVIELFDPSTGQLSVVGDLGDDRYEHTATLLEDGNVLIAGGRLPDGGRPAEKLFGAP